MNPERFSRIDAWMERLEFDALICRLPENVVYLSGTYPVLGMSVVWYAPAVGIHLLQPEFERMWVKTDRNVHYFPTGHLKDPSLKDSYLTWLNHMQTLSSNRIARIGVESEFGITAPAFNASEALLPDTSWRMVIQNAFPESEMVDCSPMLGEARGIKDKFEVDLLRRSNRIANMGLRELERVVQPELSEVEAAALVEFTIRTMGTGFEGAQLVQAFAQVTAGVEGTYRQSMLTPSSQYRFQMGDLVMIELGVCVDGYWSDLTRVYSVGNPTREQQRVYNSVRHAHRMAVQSLKNGNRWVDPDKAARKALEEDGLLDYFIHGTGHGIGCRYHESIPQLGPMRDEILMAGMVTSVEPGVYIPGFGGIRIEDNLVVTDGDAEWLSEPVEPW